MMPWTEARPKSLVEVAGRPLIDHAIDVAREAGIPRIVANTHYLPELIERHLGDTEVITVFEPELLDTGGGIRNALPFLDADSVVSLNTDVVWHGGNPISALLAAWRMDRMEAMLLLVPQDRAIGHLGAGDFRMDSGGRLSRGPGLVYTGAQIMKTGRLHAFRDASFSLNSVWDGRSADDTLFGLK